MARGRAPSSVHTQRHPQPQTTFPLQNIVTFGLHTVCAPYICQKQTKRTVPLVCGLWFPLVCGLKKSRPHQTTCNALVYIGLMRAWSFTSLPLYLGRFAAWDAAKRYSITCPCKLYFTPFLLITSWPFSIILTGLPASWSASIELIPVGSVKP